jgi:ribokinase
VGCVGTDGGFLVHLLEEQGISVDGIRVLADEVSGHAVIQVTDTGANAIVIAGGANRRLTEADFDVALSQLLPGDWLLLQNEINDLAVVLAGAATRGARVAFNVAPADGRENDYDLSQVDLLIVNESESRALVAPADSDGDDESVARILAARLPRTEVVLTRGANGLIHVKGDRLVKIDAVSVTAVDETAAGDAFIGYLMAALLAGESYDRALVVGSAAGALAVTTEGAASSIPERAAVTALIDVPRFRCD